MQPENIRCRTFVPIRMNRDFLEMGWWAFIGVEKILRRHHVTVDDLKWCYMEDNYGYVVGVFEVMRRV